MIIFHGSTEVVAVPRIIMSYTGRDFGSGFYTTDIRDQAVKWAKRQAMYRKSPDAILNVYEFDDSAFKRLNVKRFNDYSMEWLDFIIECRKNKTFQHTCDIVIGKIADDVVGETLQAVIDGLAPKEFALSKLVFMQANNQICFSTASALEYLLFISSEKVN